MGDLNKKEFTMYISKSGYEALDNTVINQHLTLDIRELFPFFSKGSIQLYPISRKTIDEVVIHLKNFINNYEL